MEPKIVTREKSKVKVKKPKHYKVIMHNDDFTTMEFVVYILTDVFRKDMLEAEKIMMDVNTEGRGVVGIYPYDIAVTKASLSMVKAKEEGFPFKVTVEEE